METEPTIPRVGFVIEGILGHAAHADNLAKLLLDEPSIEATLIELTWEMEGLPAKVPLFNSNWTVRSGVRARRAIAELMASRPLDALFIHTHVPAVLARKWMRRVPTVVSVDASPLQYDELGEHYDHAAGGVQVERLKWRANQAMFRRAAHIVSWSAWAKDGVADGYGIDPEKITVIPPGVMTAVWRPPAHAPRDDDATVRILFVGGDLRRKGGDLLLDAFHDLRSQLAESGGADVELHLVTGADVAEAPGVVVHRGMQPNSPALIELYHRSDLFCLPTRGDCLPMVLSEAGAAGLPLVSTAVAGVPEIVHDGETGLVVPVDDRAALVHALRTLVEQPALRHRLGAAASDLVAQEFDARKNTHRLVELLVATVGAPAR